MITATDLISILEERTNGTCKKSFSAVSGGLVDDERKTYSFDDIKYIYTNKNALSSADALSVTSDRVYFIEFKSGFNRSEDYSTDKSKREAQRRSIRLKACESYLFLDKVICEGEQNSFKKSYYAVIDGIEDPKGVMSEFYKEHGVKARTHSEKEELYKELVDNSLVIYRKLIGNKWAMYDEIKVIYSFEFLKNTFNIESM